MFIPSTPLQERGHTEAAREQQSHRQEAAPVPVLRQDLCQERPHAQTRSGELKKTFFMSDHQILI